MRMSVRTRLPEGRLRTALRRAATRALADAMARREGDGIGDLRQLPKTSMLGRLATKGPAAGGFGPDTAGWAKIDEN